MSSAYLSIAQATNSPWRKPLPGAGALIHAAVAILFERPRLH